MCDYKEEKANDPYALLAFFQVTAFNLSRGTLILVWLILLAFLVLVVNWFALHAFTSYFLLI